jgi:hypothetical protein
MPNFSFNMIKMIKYSPFFKIILCSLLLHFIICRTLSAQFNAGVLKAAYIERITRFIDWPRTNFDKDSTVFVIGVYEDTEFENILNDVFKEKTIKNRKVKVVQIASSDQIEPCDICYISLKGTPEIKEFITMANDCGVLMISECEYFGKEGIHINFYIENDKLKFEINTKSVDQGKFRISSLLMKSSRIIQSDENDFF